MDYLDYFTNQLPKNLASLAALRDEMAARQGAMSAVDDANGMKAQATTALETAKADAAAMRAAAAGIAAATAVDRRAADNRESALKAREDAFEDTSAKRTADQEKTERALIARELSVSDRENAISTAEAALASNTKTLDARVVAFQAKVAALTA